MNRRRTKKIKVGNIFVGGDSPISVQSMTNTDTRDVNKTVEQIKRLESEGCEIIRVAVPDFEAADAIKEIVKQIDIPLVADIHFDYRLAIKSVENGANALRINPGNIGNEIRIKEVVDAAKYYSVPIRVGVNSGSLEKEILEKYKRPCPEALVESALRNVEILEKYNFNDIVISVKSSNVKEMVDSYRLLSKNTEYPLHLGVTEAGTIYSGTVKSAIGIGALLLDGIGDTIRVSLTDDPIEEIKLGKEILQACGVRRFGVEIISCPTCGRTSIDLIGLAKKVEEELKNINKPLKVAVMGCVVNGPGEAKEADIGIAGGIKEALIFKKGKIIKKVSEENIISELIEEINKL
ncbi:flavodoxin-dependent (E)-4-hydroxy-3-methylbut-2-enyl-diphosphate synthase [Caloramator proteoclasticus]|uniref:4-hydroxy-3-methylbut-2-en-1-yl diphosphate synthase (flavodoxin) n=1 Tax=Caloramator proteoclasticus DSM 10124 TaxID=1121262 RepID=A0A1M4SLN7_9CLOT|nr:flavodoxin-dependent (E)-4-hydroxy-3-methylbut-2-enyl-diphosphate synthase [Caloramator proteoclasticus]SHE33116.1 4-hydroxy-3-methylbut-2-en-1-yl diphosphate synthase [Caloramator proteoclasticus DSM 10124]